MRYADAGEQLIPLLGDSYPRARFFAAEALGRIAFQDAFSPIVDMLEENNEEDVYLRHAGSLALARIGDAQSLTALSDHPSKAVRIAAVVALRRMEDPGIAAFLQDEDEYIVAEAARAINDDFSIEEALPRLAEVLNRDGLRSEPLLRRAINANLRVGTEEALKNLVEYISKADAPVSMRREAILTLSTWTEPSVLDRVDGRFRGSVSRTPTLLKDFTSDILIDLIDHSNDTLRLAAVNAVGNINLLAASENLFTRLKTDANEEVREASLRSLGNMEWEKLDLALEQASTDKSKNVRVASLDLMGEMDFSGELLAELLAGVIEQQTIEEKQAAVLTLARVEEDFSIPVFENLLDQLGKGTLSPGMELELLEALEALENETLLQKYQEVNSSLNEDDLLASYSGSLYGGDTRSGRRIFFQHQTGQCIRCHAYNDFGGNAGPRLNGIGKKLDREQLLEALIDPSKRVAPGYGVVTLKMVNDETVSGILLDENEETVTLKIGNDPEKKILKTEISERTNAMSSMPDMKGLLSRREIRDLVSFLATLTDDDYTDSNH